MENLNIFSSKGFITRSGFFAAYLISGLIASFFSMTGSVFAIGIFKSVSLLCFLAAITGCLLCSYFTFANLKKRFCDIKEKKLCIVSYLFLYIISFLDASCYFGGYLNNEKLLFSFCLLPFYPLSGAKIKQIILLLILPLFSER